MKNLSRIISLPFIAWLLTACFQVGPDYAPPEPSVAGQWQQGANVDYVQQHGDLSSWWTVFNDPLLNRLIVEAIDGNLNLRLAMLRIEQARAVLAIAYSGYFPTGNFEPGIQWGQTSKQISPSGGEFHSQTNINLGTSWELDLFGRISRSVEASEADLESFEEARNGTLVALTAQVAQSYLLLRTTQSNLAVALKNIDAQKSILDLTMTREQSGLASGLDVAQAERVLATSEADVPPLRAQLVQSLNALALLLGKQPGFLADQLSIAQALPLPPLEIMTGVPADIIRQRPDIREAERVLAAETARIGVARADLYPTLSLSGLFGFGALDFSNVFHGNSFGYSVGPGFLWTVFDGGRIRAQIAQQETIAEQAYVQYEQTILNALSEVENSMKAYVEERARTAALERAVQASQKTLDLASDLYKDGLADFQNVLDAETALFTNESQLATSRGQAVTDLVLLYKALGGGWQTEDVQSSPAGIPASGAAVPPSTPVPLSTPSLSTP